MNDHDDQALSALYRQTRDEAGPSELLDRRIRNAARRHLRQRSRRWLWGLSSAAVLVLSFSVVLQLQRQSDESGVPVLSQKAREPLSTHESYPLVLPPPSAPVENFAERKKAEARRQVLRQEAEQKQRLAKEQAQGRAAAEMAEMDSYSFADSPMSMAPSQSAAAGPAIPFVPKLPLQKAGLLALDPELKAGPQSTGKMLELYYRGNRVMRLRRDEVEAVFEAWPGSEILGVKADWSVSRRDFSNCIWEDDSRVCPWHSEIEAVFNDLGLDHIRWSQKP